VENRPGIIIITGLSGAGKTVALRALEDSGFYAIDNLPLPLLGDVIGFSRNNPGLGKIALGIDVREKELLREIQRVVDDIRASARIKIIFLEAERGVLMRRYKESRRPHPLMGEGSQPMEKLIERETELLEPLREAADRIIDTSSLTPHQLRNMMMENVSGKEGTGAEITLISFGYKFGIPQNIDLLLDIRFLPNPHFVPELRPLTGLDAPVQEYVLESSLTAEFLRRAEDFLEFLVPQYRKEGRSNILIGIGCTGGQHRSPAITEALSARLSKRLGIPVRRVHREL
jgi:UPF0042 nucleotide-binding protein